jgi:hypothetical protein
VRSAFLITLGLGCDEELYNVTDSKSDPPGGGLSAWQVGDIVEITNFQKLPKGALRLQAGASVILSGVKEVSTIPVDTKSIKNTSNNSVSIAHLSTFGNFRIPSNGRIARLHQRRIRVFKDPKRTSKALREMATMNGKKAKIEIVMAVPRRTHEFTRSLSSPAMLTFLEYHLLPRLFGAS